MAHLRQGQPEAHQTPRPAKPGDCLATGHDVPLRHMAQVGDDLTEVGRWLDAYLNMYLYINACINVLGYQPYASWRFLLKYQDRVMCGTDTATERTAYRMYYRLLE